jgi:hypothetical protein
MDTKKKLKEEFGEKITFWVEVAIHKMFYHMVLQKML